MAEDRFHIDFENTVALTMSADNSVTLKSFPCKYKLERQLSTIYFVKRELETSENILILDIVFSVSTIPKDFEDENKRWEIVVTSLKVNKMEVKTPDFVINCLCYIEKIRQSLLLLLREKHVDEFELKLFVQREGKRLSEVQFTSLQGLTTWTIFQLNMSVPDVLKEMTDSLPTFHTVLRTHYRKMYRDMMLSGDYLTMLLEYWGSRQNHVKDGICQASRCVLKYSLSLRELRDLHLSNMILYHFEAFKHMGLKGRFSFSNCNSSNTSRSQSHGSNSKLRPWSFTYGPHREKSVLGEVFACYPGEARRKGEVFFALKNFWHRSESEITPAQNVLGSNFLTLTPFRPNLIVESFAWLNQPDSTDTNIRNVLSLKELAEKKAFDCFSRQIVDVKANGTITNCCAQFEWMLCTCFAKHVYNNLKALVGFAEATRLTNGILENVAITRLITRKDNNLFTGDCLVPNKSVLSLNFNFDDCLH